MTPIADNGIELVHPVPVDLAVAASYAMNAVFLGDPELVAHHAQWREAVWHPDRTWVARDRGRIVATLMTRGEPMSVPGPAGGTCPTVAADMLTGVTVNPTHRRRGLLRRLIGESLAAARERGDPVSVLVAAEYGIYGRFGYSPAVWERNLRINVRTPGARSAAPTPGAVHQVEAQHVETRAPAVYAAEATGRAGLLARGSEWWDYVLGRTGAGREWNPTREQRSNRHILHEGPSGVDGYLRWNVQPGTGAEGQGETVLVKDLLAANPTARRELFSYLLGLDLVTTIELPGHPVDDDIRWYLDNGRALRTTAIDDAMWLRILDVPKALSARGYAVPDRLVLEVADPAPGGWAAGRYRLDAGPDGATCTAAPQVQPDLTLAQSTLASIYLGGVRAAELALTGAIDEHTPGATARLDTLFGTGLAPWRATDF